MLQKATVQPMSKYGLPIEAGIIGFLIGLLGGAVFVLIRAQRGGRLRFRDEIARVAGAPVLASLEAPGCANCFRMARTARRERTEPATNGRSASFSYAVQNGAGPRSAVRVISFADDSAALTTGPRLALQAAANGIRTSLAPGDQPELDHSRSLRCGRRSPGGEAVGRGTPPHLGAADDGGVPRATARSQSSCSTELSRRWPLLMR